ncbi:hypothetical protein B0I72DRAFT_138468 [Yarrowia lipolytica]|jgi:hypothetical protein|uniref:YALI0A14608p n=2 Tax=Yarrowia lipolytica TaxID=4952 RepID=Q6CGZ8_YARLI|nr:YALI0A14608p [Yarrowia lipolytica CLIB122]AOW00648.1 hypothetical protein YALI1_A14513g [Yarrowia lipolytica]KAB8283241.1 hypothetical protein BKA91DRAFT_137056 [Yarrowia lipolytica]KAE8174033.1 hypothetical protein BKA90DRAFT_134679 [Yarrowia lipolytica]KAJ8051667.1 hypothetical protein LXG23DRAFT_39374 [Yarrowia lipolytica]QNP95229.1 Hypothetical protein YALI2_A00228g [Yarrowia lipolytica]|eukprot:XP_500064.1 YALI0A14608p [Yarrowia lipolytica CLIB122]
MTDDRGPGHIPVDFTEPRGADNFTTPPDSPSDTSSTANRDPQQVDPQPFYTDIVEDDEYNRYNHEEQELHRIQTNATTTSMKSIRRTGTLLGNNIPYNRAFPNRPPGRKRQKLLQYFFRPAWLFDHMDIISFKTVIRSWIGVSLGFMLMMIPAFVRWCGSAPYLLPVVAVIVPAGSQPITVCFIINAIMCLFTCMGYAVMVIAMRINNTWFHNSINAEGMARQMIQEGLCAAPDSNDPNSRATLTACVIDQVYAGKFMTARGSVVYCVLLGAFMFFMLWMKNKSRILIPGYLCGVIAVGALMPLAHMFPYFSPNTIGLTLVKPMGLQFAINVALSILVFPFSSGFQFTQTALSELKILEGLVKFHENFMTSTLPSNEADWLNFSQTEADVQKARQLYPKLEAEAALLPIELTYSRFAFPDYTALKTSVGRVISGMSGLVYFYDNVENIRRSILLVETAGRPIDMSRKLADSTGNDSRKVDSMLKRRKKDTGRFDIDEKKKPAPVGVYEIKTGIKGAKAQYPDSLTMEELDALMIQLREMSLPFVEQVRLALETMIKWLAAANVYRVNSLFFFWQKKGHRQRQTELAAELAERRQAFKEAAHDFLNSKRFELFQSLEDSDEKTSFVTFYFQGALYCTYMKGVAETIDLLFTTLSNMDETESKPSWTIGKGSSKNDKAKSTEAAPAAGENAGRGSSEEESESSETSGIWTGVERELKSYAHGHEEHLCNNDDLEELYAQSIHGAGIDGDRKRNPDAKPPTTRVGKFGVKLNRVIKHLMSPDIIVPLKGAIFTILCALPFYFKSTAPWWRENRLVWAVIMTGLSISENMADNLYGFGSRILYTFYAGVIGMVAWYISTGNGDGNRAGFMVTTCILYFVLMFYREFSVHSTPMPQIVMVVTTVIILGMSWTDGTGVTTPSIGVGFAVAWKRFVTVVIGLSYGFICTLLPRPVTGKKIIRTTLASIIKDTGTLYCRISDFAVGRLAHPHKDVDLNNDPIFKSIVGAQNRIAGSEFLASMVMYEPSLQGQWPSKVYREITTIVSELVELHHHLYIVLRRIEDPRYWFPHLLDLVGWGDQPLMSHYFAVLYMAQGALYDGSPLPQVTPAMLMVEHLDHLEGLFKTSFDAEARHSMGESARSDFEPQPETNQISLERLKSNDGLIFSAAIVLSNCIFDRMDRLMFQVKTLVGEQFVNSEYYRDRTRFKNDRLV